MFPTENPRCIRCHGLMIYEPQYGWYPPMWRCVACGSYQQIGQIEIQPKRIHRMGHGGHWVGRQIPQSDLKNLSSRELADKWGLSMGGAVHMRCRYRKQLLTQPGQRCAEAE
jgi:hypothetical protein